MEKKTISLLEEGLINLDYPLYNILISENAPQWWTLLKNDKEIYIDIRKGNVIDAYYRGGRIAGIVYSGRSKTITVKAHPKYLGHTDSTDINYYKKRVRDGHVTFDPIYQDCSDWIINRMSELKNNIQEHYSGDFEGEDTSEKFIQWNLVINGRDKYLDSEFSHRFYDEKRESIRIDLLKIENGHFVFEELKRIKDNRLRTNKGIPEIITQMQNYRAFIGENYDRMTKYYRELYKIKVKLGLPVPPVTDINSICMDPEPCLLLANFYDKESPARKERITKIQEVLATINVIPKIISE